MLITNVHQSDLLNCAILVETITKRARFADMTMQQQDQLKQAVSWLGEMAGIMGREWQTAKGKKETEQAIVKAVKSPKSESITVNPKRISKATKNKKSIGK